MHGMARDYVLAPFRPPVDLAIDYRRELNEQQYEAVTAPPGPALVIAGAGAGKTRTLIYRVAFLLEQGVPPERILLLTFTNKAAHEMMRRAGQLLTHDLDALWGGTFHSIGNRILRRHADRLGYRRDFTILDREDARDLVSACLGEAKIDVKATRFPKADALCDLFSLAANMQQPLPQLFERRYRHFAGLVAQITDLERRYAERKRQTGVMDFDDLLVLWLRLLEQHPDVREQYQRRFQFILVDEYQDTNRLQSDLVDLLAAHHHNIMAVGDDSQSIYSWRGANFLNILKFADRHPDARVYKIETNYRSTPEILQLANAAIAANAQQYAKQLAPVRPSGSRPGLVVCDDATTQAAFVAQRALELREEGVPLANMAVLYRSHFHAMELQFELTRRNIPFTITSGLRFFEQAHIKDVAAYLKLVVNPADEIAFKRLVRMLPGIGPKAADKLWSRFHPPPAPEPVASEPEPPLGGPEGRGPSSEAPLTANPPAAPTANHQPPLTNHESPITNPQSPITNHTSPPSDPRAPLPAEPRLAAALQSLSAAVPRKTATAWAQFTATMAQLEAPDVRDQPATMIGLVIEAVYEEYLEANYANYRNRLEDLEQLATYAGQYHHTADFLTQLALMTTLEAEAEARPADDDERLRLSTIHQAKGLEFDVVFVIMLCEGLFPSARSAEDLAGEEEERRLFYVAVTRARNELYLSYPLIRTAAAMAGDYRQRPSRFLGELPRALLEEWNLRTYGGAY